jgi:hypothetical protein
MGLRRFPVACVGAALFACVPETNEWMKCRSQAPEEAREQYFLLCQQLFHTMALLKTTSPAQKYEMWSELKKIILYGRTVFTTLEY